VSNKEEKKPGKDGQKKKKNKDGYIFIFGFDAFLKKNIMKI